MRHWIAIVLMATVIAGCSGRRQPDPRPEVTIVNPLRGDLIYREVIDIGQVRPNDDLQVTVDVVQVSAPIGTLAEKAELWQIVSPGSIRADLQHRLNLNGIRAGVMRARDWSAAKEILEQAPDVVSQTAALAGKSRVSLNTQKKPQLTIFYFDREQNLQGRTYDASESFWGIHFAPDPARPGNTSLELTPVIRSVRRQMRLNRYGEDYHIEYEQPESVFDLSFRVSLPVGSVLVIAPTRTAAESPSSIGRAFLTREQPGGLTEEIIFLYPRLYRLAAGGKE